MEKIEKLEEFERAVRRIDPDFAQHLIGAALALVTGLGILALVVSGMTAAVPLVPIL